MKYNIKYVGFYGTVDFSTAPILYEENTFFKYEWELDSSKSAYGNGSIINNIGFTGVNRSLVVNIIGKNVSKLLNDIENIATYDVSNKSPGKLFINNQYVECYIVGIDHKVEDLSIKQTVTINFFIINPKWTIEKTFNFSRFDERDTAEGFQIPFSFPFSFKKIKPASRVHNDSILETKGLIKLYGPCVNPSFFVNNIQYKMNLELLENERVEIDQRQGTIFKVTALGTRVDMFNYREIGTNKDVFCPFPSGTFEVSYTGNFSLSLTLYIERNLPLWI